MSTFKICDVCGNDITEHSQLTRIETLIDRHGYPLIKHHADVCKSCTEKTVTVIIMTADEVFKHNRISKESKI